MPTLPQLLEEDIQGLNAALQELLTQSDAAVALVIDKAGFLITQCGQADEFDTTTLGALAAGSFAATQTIASLVSEGNFSSVYQQGENNSLLVLNVDQYCLLMVVFPARVSVGAVKYFALDTIKLVAQHMEAAQTRAPEDGMDLSMLNLANTQPLFTKRNA